MLFSLGFIAMFLLGGISGVMHAVSAHDAQQQDTYFVPAHIHYVLFGGAIMAILSGIFYWFPKYSGKMYSERQGKISFWLIMLGQNVTFFPMHFVGLDGMPRRIYTYVEGMGWEFWNGVSTGGVFILIIGFLLVVVNIGRHWKNGEPAPADPWDARTLEWSIPSPPPEYNFEKIPIVRSLDDWWETKQGLDYKEVPASGGSGNEGHEIHLPQPSYWPIVAAFGLFIAAYGVVFNDLLIPWALAAVGLTIGFIGVYSWSLEPVNDPEEDSTN
jgi:cytochrome c oxidase subunit 1